MGKKSKASGEEVTASESVEVASKDKKHAATTDDAPAVKSKKEKKSKHVEAEHVSSTPTSKPKEASSAGVPSLALEDISV